MVSSDCGQQELSSSTPRIATFAKSFRRFLYAGPNCQAGPTCHAVRDRSHMSCAGEAGPTCHQGPTGQAGWAKGGTHMSGWVG